MTDYPPASPPKVDDAQAGYPAITVYTKPECPGCKLVKNELEKAGVDYELVDIFDNEDAYTYVTKVLGYQSVPIVVSDMAKPIVGFKPEELKALIKLVKEDHA